MKSGVHRLRRSGVIAVFVIGVCAGTLAGVAFADIYCGSGYCAGTNGGDDIHGTDGFNEIHAFDGLDRVWAKAAGDSLYAGDQADRINAEDGPDVIHGQLGNDGYNPGTTDCILVRGDCAALVGNAGADTIYGFDGWDLLIGFNEYDEMYGDNHDDSLAAQDGGRDLVHGGPNGSRGDACLLDAVDTWLSCEIR